MAGDDTAIFGDLVRRARRAAGYSQEELADRSGLSVRGISDLERGVNRTPRKDTLEMLATALDLSADERKMWDRARRQFARRDGQSQPIAGNLSNVPNSAPLPARLTSFVGREQELSGLRDRLSQPGVRLVTVTGPGGIGKTSLVIHVAGSVAATFHDGVRFVSLAPISDSALVATEIIRVIGLQVRGAERPVEELISYLSTRQLLLVLDNFEHLIDAATLVAELLAACPALTIVVTSRAPLRVSGEWEFPLSPLSVPRHEDPAGIDAIAASAAVALFVERAQAVRPDFALSVENAATVAEICRRLDGLPLSIELAAARIRHIPPAAILARLAKQLDFLAGGVRDAPTRQRTLRDTIAWSYDLMSADEQYLLRAVSIFRGGWTIDAARAVVGKSLVIDVVDGMDRLIEHSLVRSIEQPDGDVRCHMLEAIREFGLEKLDGNDELHMWKHRHERYFVALAERAGRELRGPDQVHWFAMLDLEHANLRATLTSLLDRGDGVTALRTTVNMVLFWRLRGHVLEARQWLERSVAAGDAAPAAVQAAAYMAIGGFARSHGDDAAAEHALTIASARYRESGDDVGVASATSSRAWNAIYRGDYRQASNLFEQAMSVANAIGDEHLLATLLAGQSVGWAVLCEYELGLAAAEESLKRFWALGDRRNISQVLGFLGYYWLWKGDIDRAEQFGNESLTMALELGLDQVSFAEELLGYVALERKEFLKAESHFRNSIEQAHQQFAVMNLAESLEGLAGVALGLDDLERGVVLLGAADAVRTRYGSPIPPPRQDRYQRTLYELTSGLDESTFQQAWTWGQSMATEQAVAYGVRPARTRARDRT
jgi:predicted ATPase/transcriptional regulator with XRE-family HTH domain